MSRTSGLDASERQTSGRRGPFRRSRRARTELGVTRTQHRTSAFVYGNITALGALVSVDAHAVGTGAAAVAVAVTSAATFVAHVTADLVSERIRPDHGREKGRTELLQELRDAVPIATSGSAPLLLLLLGGADLLSPEPALWAGIAVVVTRLALIGTLVERLSGRRASTAALWGGVGLAVVSGGIAVVKGLLTH